MIKDLEHRFCDIEEFSGGSTSKVYKALDIHNSREVIIKRFVEEEDSDLTFVEQWKRFKREVEIHQSLEHENIIKVHEFIQVEANLYLVMEYRKTKTLQQMIDDSEFLDLFEIISIIQQVASALQYIHDKGVIHRDVKPGNILITEDLQVLLIDFGCSKKIYTTEITVVKMMIGTISYMSPEQLTGNNESIDGRTDIFSLGCLFYQLLTNNLPFRGKNIRESVNNLFTINPKSVSALNPSVPFDLEQTVHNTLKIDPDIRCPTAKLLIHNLNQILNQPEIYYNQGKYYENFKGDLKKAYVFYQKAVEKKHDYFDAWLAIAELYYLSQDWELAMENYEYLIKLDSSKADLYSKLGDIKLRLGNHSYALKMFQKAWVLNPEEKEYEIKMCYALFLCGKELEAIENYRSIIKRHTTWLQPKYELALIYYNKNNKNEALVLFEEAIRLDENNKEILSYLGALYQELGKIDESIEVYEKMEHMNFNLNILHNLACAYYQKGQFDQAASKIEKMENIGLFYADSYILKGLVNEKIENIDEAISCYENAIKLSPDNLSAYLYLSSVLKTKWRLKDAIDTLINASKIKTKYSKANVYFQLAEIYREKGMYSEAKDSYKECLSRSKPGDLHEKANKQLKLIRISERKRRKNLIIENKNLYSV